MSRCLTDQGIDHVVFERGRIAERWRSERWDSLRLLTPNWMTRLPGWSYDGPHPDGYMTAGEVVTFFERYAASAHAPVQQETAVEWLRFDGDTYNVETSTGSWQAANVVIATGWCDRPAIPPLARHLPPGIHQLAPSHYHNPDSLPDGGVLVVGASATGVQIADELRHAGREVVLAVGRHSRLPRRHRGMDIFWWLERIGNFDKTVDQLTDPVRARHEPSVQLVGRPDGRSLDLTTLQQAGVRITGRLNGVNGHHVQFADDLAHNTSAADQQMRRVLAEIDRHVDDSGLTGEVLAVEPIVRFQPAPAAERIDLRAAGVTSVLWATGHRRSYPWLRLPVLDNAGEIRQHRGLTPLPGLYVLGQRFQHYRSSNFIDGVGRDATYIAEHLTRRRAPANHQ